MNYHKTEYIFPSPSGAHSLTSIYKVLHQIVSLSTAMNDIRPSTHNLPSPSPTLIPLLAPYPKAGLSAYPTYNSSFCPCLKHYTASRISTAPSQVNKTTTKQSRSRVQTHPPKILHALVQGWGKHVPNVAKHALVGLKPELVADLPDDDFEAVGCCHHEDHGGHAGRGADGYEVDADCEREGRTLAGCVRWVAFFSL